VCCCVLQCVAQIRSALMCCSVVYCGAVQCGTVQVYSSVLQCERGTDAQCICACGCACACARVWRGVLVRKAVLHLIPLLHAVARRRAHTHTPITHTDTETDTQTPQTDRHRHRHRHRHKYEHRHRHTLSHTNTHRGMTNRPSTFRGKAIIIQMAEEKRVRGTE